MRLRGAGEMRAAYDRAYAGFFLRRGGCGPLGCLGKILWVLHNTAIALRLRELPSAAPQPDNVTCPTAKLIVGAIIDRPF